jgi:hypothetical protein
LGKTYPEMNIFNYKWLFYSWLIISLLLTTCKKDNTVSDVEKLVALKNVIITYDSITFQIILPAGALGGKSFEQLKNENPGTYTNLANYSIIFSNNYTASNKKSNAEDAKFDGMALIVIMDTINSSPIHATSNAFEVKKNTSIPVQIASTINLATHKRAGVYIFRQVIAGNDLATTQTIALNYKIGVLQGKIDLPSFKENIPTRASNEMKAFLQGLLNSGLLNK